MALKIFLPHQGDGERETKRCISDLERGLAAALDPPGDKIQLVECKRRYHFDLSLKLGHVVPKLIY